MSAQVTDVRVKAMTAEGAALTECSNESGGRRAVLPTGSTSGTCEGWTGFPGAGGGVRTCWAVYMVVFTP